jgi:hypothetical protein
MVKARINMMIPVMTYRLANATMANPKQDRNSGTETKMKSEETINTAIPMSKQRHDQTEGFQSFAE